MKRAYKFRFYPTPAQAVELNRTFGCCRFVWNKALAERQALYAAERKSISYGDMDKRLTSWKRTEGMNFLAEVAAVPLQQTLRHQQCAFTNFFAKRSKYPRFKSRAGRQTASYTRNAFRWREDELFLARIDKPLTIRWSRAVPEGTPSTVTISRDAAGRWFVSMLFEDTVETLPPNGNAVGIDLGLTHFAVLSTGEKVEHPNLLRKREQRLARYQRAMSRKKLGSQNRDKSRKKVAKQHTKVSDARKDFLHKTSTDIVRNHDTIVVEDLAVQNMVKNRRLSKSISDSGWAQFRRLLEYKSAWYGRRFIVIERFYPSTKTCSSCGHRLEHLALSTRSWTCPICSTLHDRDVNAAKNILAARLAVEACGADVSHAEETPVRSAVNQEPISLVGAR